VTTEDPTGQERPVSAMSLPELVAEMERVEMALRTQVDKLAALLRGGVR
jgi:hypothetical protein